MTTSTEKIDPVLELAVLKRFCGEDIGTAGGHSAQQMRLPFARGGWLYATDGTIVARVPTDLPDETERKAPRAWELFSQFPTDLERLEPLRGWLTTMNDDGQFCHRCDARVRLCEDCYGSGGSTCSACDHYHRCERCRGRGWRGRRCDVCREKRGYVAANVCGEGWGVSVRNFGRLKSLVGVRLGVPIPPANSLVPFVFEGGQGFFATVVGENAPSAPAPAAG